MPTEYPAQILQLRLPEQNDLKNDSERCSADPVKLESIGRSIGQQVRITRSDRPNFVAVYTVKQANPDYDVVDPKRDNVVRTGKTGRERLGTDAEMAAVVQAKVVDDPPKPGKPDAARFFELADDDGKQPYFIAIAPHGGEIERHTDEQAEQAVRELTAACFPASSWLCKGDGDKDKGAFDRWHITSEDIQPACFPLLEPLVSRTFCYGVAFHGFQRKEDEADIYIGGAGSPLLKLSIERALIALKLPIKIKISTRYDKPKFQGFSPENIINRLAASGIQLEQSHQAREYCAEIACAVAKVFASRLRHLFCIFIKNLQKKRIDAEAELARSLSKDLARGPLSVESAIAKHKAWRAIDDALAAKTQAAEEVRAFIEERIEDLKTTQPEAGFPAQTSGNRKRRPRSRKTRKS
ncbi:MAG: poly-gamma-glutamate hydrolase family protein [Terrimicrobiaceae bacterium]